MIELTQMRSEIPISEMWIFEPILQIHDTRTESNSGDESKYLGVFLHAGSIG